MTRGQQRLELGEMTVLSWRHFIGRGLVHGAIACALTLVSQAASAAAAQDEVDRLPPALSREIGQSVAELLGADRVPSASVAILRNGELVYARAFGQATLSPARPASAGTIYAIGSNSKSFTAAAIMLLVDEGRMSLDDKLSTWFPSLTGASTTTVRQLLTHTAGYPDYYPQDYVVPAMKKAISPDDLVRRWGTQPLDFPPGTAWQYSNTGYVIAGRIVEKVSGERLFDFLTTRIFKPLGMTSATDYDRRDVGPAGATGYVRAEFGPLESTPKLGEGWTFAAGDLAMTASDLLRWDSCLMSGCLLSATARAAMVTPMRLADGTSTDYGLGLQVTERNHRRAFGHSGGVPGFTSEHIAYPDDGIAIVVLTNAESGSLLDRLLNRLQFALLPTDGIEGRLRRHIDALQAGVPIRDELTANLNEYWAPRNVRVVSGALRRLGQLRAIKPLSPPTARGGMTVQEFQAEFSGGIISVSTIVTAAGRFEQLILAVPPL